MKTTVETETRAMFDMASTLETLDPEARKRVWFWLGQRAGIVPTPKIAGPGLMPGMGMPMPGVLGSIQVPADHPLAQMFPQLANGAEDNDDED